MAAKILITREKAFTDSLRRYHVVLDGQKIGLLSNGESAEIELAPGKHTLRAKIDWCGSRTIEFTINDGETKRFACQSNLTGLKMFLGIFYVIFNRHSYLQLNEV